MKSVQHELIHAIVLEVKPYPWEYFGDIVEIPSRISFNISRRYVCGATFDFRRGYKELKETPVIRSPYALNLIEFIRMSDEERDKLYTHNNDDLSEPYTIIDVITKVYHRCFIDDLRESVSGYPGILKVFKRSSDEWTIDTYKVESFRIIHPESVFGQPINDFTVDIYGEARIMLSEINKNCNRILNIYRVNVPVRLRYSFDLRAYELSCRFLALITDEREGIYSVYPGSFHLDKYLIPVLSSKEDYEKMARYIIEQDMPECLDTDTQFSALDWVYKMGLGAYFVELPDKSVMGEYYFSFGKEKLISCDTRECNDVKITPGTVLINRKACNTEGKVNSTAAHEGIHHRLGVPFFLLQMTHGGINSSILFKRVGEQRERFTKWTPAEIMELHANKLPAYLLIQEKPGKAKAKAFYDSYGDMPKIEKMRRLVDDMADYFGVTKTIARSRLYEFGYRQVSGISMYINGKSVPSYISDLPKKLTYSIDERDAVSEYQRNPEFRKLLDTGIYEYVEWHFCIRHRKYICTDIYGNKRLTDYARAHMDECCLVFEEGYENGVDSSSGSFLRKRTASKKVITYTTQNGGSPVTAEGMEVLEEIKREMEERKLMEKSFNQMTKELMKLKGFTKERLAEETGLSVETITKMRCNPNMYFSIQTVAAVCIAMHLSPEMRKVYIDKSPAKFLENLEMNLYRYALAKWSDLSVAEVNRKLIEYGGKPLTNLVEGLDCDIFAITG